MQVAFKPSIGALGIFDSLGINASLVSEELQSIIPSEDKKTTDLVLIKNIVARHVSYVSAFAANAADYVEPLHTGSKVFERMHQNWRPGELPVQYLQTASGYTREELGWLIQTFKNKNIGREGYVNYSQLKQRASKATA